MHAGTEPREYDLSTARRSGPATHRFRLDRMRPACTMGMRVEPNVPVTGRNVWDEPYFFRRSPSWRGRV